MSVVGAGAPSGKFGSRCFPLVLGTHGAEHSGCLGFGKGSVGENGDPSRGDHMIRIALANQFLVSLLDGGGQMLR